MRNSGFSSSSDQTILFLSEKYPGPYPVVHAEDEKTLQLKFLYSQKNKEIGEDELKSR